MRILLADDEPQIRRLYREMLEGNGYEVTVAEDGTDVMERIAEADHDLMVLDLYMPNMDGFEVLKALQAEEQHVPVIVMTGHFPDDVVAERLRGLEVVEVLRKPVMISTLINVVNRVASKGGERAEGRGQR